MDPALWELYESGPPDEEVAVMLRLDPGAEPPPGVRVVCRFGLIVTARLRRGDIPPLRNRGEVLSLKAPRPVWPSDPPLSAIRSPTRGARLRRRPTDRARPAGFDGRGVVVGICDWGFDFTHPNFRNPDGSTRLLALWDQRGTGHPLAPEPYRMGRLLTRERINAALAQPDPCAALDYYPSLDGPRIKGSHGTHVADILAGNRREPGSEVGLASGADIVFVHLGAQRLRPLENLGDSVSLLEGLDFVRRAAAGRPCVMHLSAGKTAGPHLGTTPLERAVDHMLLHTPGLALVQSAGNYGDAALHTHARVGPDQQHTFRWLIPDEDGTANELELWYSGQDVFDLTLIAPGGQTFSAPLGTRLPLSDGLEHWGNLYHRRREPNSGLHHVDVFLYKDAPAGTWRVQVRGREVVDGRIHAWIERDLGGRYQSRFPRRESTSRYSVNSICNCLRAIAVGAYDDTRAGRPPTRFSSRGPTADGRQKPELAAPGYRIRAARSVPRSGWSGEPRLTVKSGTSMAAPFVSGTVALMMQAAGRPLAIHEVRRLLIGTADPHGGPSGRSSSRLGYGYLNVAAAVEAARRLGAEEPDPPPPSETAPDEESGWGTAWWPQD
jgi:subtilisin family serine protease